MAQEASLGKNDVWRIDRFGSGKTSLRGDDGIRPLANHPRGRKSSMRNRGNPAPLEAANG
jgi:hypothetical protein